jgi:hypothetical protein
MSHMMSCICMSLHWPIHDTHICSHIPILVCHIPSITYWHMYLMNKWLIYDSCAPFSFSLTLLLSRAPSLRRCFSLSLPSPSQNWRKTISSEQNRSWIFFGARRFCHCKWFCHLNTTTFLTLGNGTLGNGCKSVARRAICNAFIYVDRWLFFILNSDEKRCLFN